MVMRRHDGFARKPTPGHPGPVDVREAGRDGPRVPATVRSAPNGTDRIPDGEETLAGPTNAGPYFTTWGPLDGPILRRHQPPALSVVPAPDCYWPIGIAFPVGQVAHRRGPAATFRLVVEKAEVEGRWVCVGRRFVRLGDAAEEL